MLNCFAHHVAPVSCLYFMGIYLAFTSSTRKVTMDRPLQIRCCI